MPDLSLHKSAFRTLFQAYKDRCSEDDPCLDVDLVGDFLEEFAAPHDGIFRDFDCWWLDVMGSKG